MQAHVQGKSGLGATASTGLQAYNNYINETGFINRNYADNMRQIGEAETGKLSELENYRRSTISDSQKALGDAIAAADNSAGESALKYYRQWQEDQEAEAYDSAADWVSSYDGTDAAAAETKLRELYGGKFSEEQLNALIAQLGSDVSGRIETNRENANKEAASYVESYTGRDLTAAISELSAKYGDVLTPEQLAILSEKLKTVVDTNDDAARAEMNSAAQAYIDAYGDTDPAALEAWLKKHYGITDPVATVNEDGTTTVSGGYTGGNTDYDTMLAAGRSRVEGIKTAKGTDSYNNAVNWINAYSDLDYQTALAELEKLKGYMSDDQFTTLSESLKTKVGQNEAADEEKRKKADNALIGDGTNPGWLDLYYDTASEKLAELEKHKDYMTPSVYEREKARLEEEVVFENKVTAAKNSNTANVRWEKGDAPDGPNERFVAYMDNADGSREKLVLGTAGEITSGDVYNIAQEIDTGILFAYDGKMYIKNEEGRVFGVQRYNPVRDTSYQDALKALGLK